MKFLLPEGWESPKGYSQGVVAEGRQIFISGQIGWDENSIFQTDDFAEQAGQALRNIISILAEADASADNF